MEKLMLARQLLIVIVALGASTQVSASWSLDYTSSSLSFVSIKAIDIAEVHRFKELAGEISDKGKAVVEVKLSSVDTGIPVRDERMQEMLFETGDYPFAIARTEIDMELIEALVPGSSKPMELEFTLDLHGIRVPMGASVVVTRLTESTLTVISSKPLVLNAASAGLKEGIEALRKVANLPSIGAAVPVSFVLTFIQEE